MTSILTNTAAMSALQTLRSLDASMEETQARVASGLRVGTASDNAAYWSIATTMRSDNMALSAVQDALGLGAAKVDTAYAAMETSVDVVKEMKAKIVAATEAGVDKAKIQEEIKQLQQQLVSISQSASFSGENWLQADLSGAEDGTITKQVVGSFIRNSDGTVRVQNIDFILSSGTVLFDTNKTTTNKLGILDSTAKLDEMMVEVDVTLARPVTVTTAQLAGDPSNALTIDGTTEMYTTDTAETYVRYYQDSAPVLDKNGNELWVKVEKAVAAPAAPNDVPATGPTGADLADGTSSYFIATSPVAEKTTVAATTAAGLAAANSPITLSAAATYTPATGAFGGTLTAADIAVFTATKFQKVEVGTGGVATVYSEYTTAGVPNKTETYIKLGADNVWVKAAEATTAEGIAAAAAGQQGVDVGGDIYYVDTENTTAPGDIETDLGVSISDLDITDLATLASRMGPGATETDALDFLVQFIDTQLEAMVSATAELGSISMRIGMQEDFVSKLTDSIDSGIGRLVDADMNEESTRLAALQTQQQLGIQALSIANTNSENILSLFRQ